MYRTKYDSQNPKSIEAYGKEMIGKTFREIHEHAVSDKSVSESQDDYITRHSDKKYKGGLGTLIEECWFGYKANSDSNADFEEAGVELKVTPYKENLNGYAAKERLVITMINYMEIVKEQDFSRSHLWSKAQLILLVWYLHIKGRNDIDSTIDFVQLFSPPAEDLAIIKEDYAKIVGKIRAGKAHELSEGDTLYLGACTKASTSNDRRQQPYSDEPAKPRAFSYKNSYMTYVLNHYIMPGKITYEHIVKPGESVPEFESFITSKIAEYRGYSIAELCDCLDMASKSSKLPKDVTSTIAFRILGISSNKCEEFEKAGIIMKTIRINRKGKIKENMSFPSFRYDKLINETWENCTFGNYLRETRFFFVIYSEDESGTLRLHGGKFWNMPTTHIEGDVRSVWQETHDIIKEGRLILDIDAKGTITNNLPKKKDHPISHVRPHGRNRDDTYPLPKGTQLTIKSVGNITWNDNTRYTKQCFWLNNDYILSQIKESNV